MDLFYPGISPRRYGCNALQNDAIPFLRFLSILMVINPMPVSQIVLVLFFSRFLNVIKIAGPAAFFFIFSVISLFGDFP
jgi:hypothetical protein